MPPVSKHQENANAPPFDLPSGGPASGIMPESARTRADGGPETDRTATSHGSRLCDLCSRMARFSSQRNIHACVSCFEDMDPLQVHTELHYIAHSQFAKHPRVSSANQRPIHH